MDEKKKNKIIMFKEDSELFKKINNLHKKKKVVGLCHGVFDIIHNGHIKYFKEAKKECDFLIVSVTTDKFVNKGPRRPLNSTASRIEVISSIKYVDMVIESNYDSAVFNISKIKPSYYFKGYDYKNADYIGNLKKEIDILKKYKGKFKIIKQPLKSSTKFFNKINNSFTKEEIKIIKNVNKLINFKKLNEKINSLKKYEIDIIGEPILDKYTYVEKSNLSNKDAILSVINKNYDVHEGGVLLIAKILSNFVKKVNLFTYCNDKFKKKFISKNRNINLINLNNKKKIQEKNRILNSYRNEKFLQITNFKKNYFSNSEQKNIIKKLKKIKKEIIIVDYGIGLFEKEILNFFNKTKLKKFINVQSNSINLGFNRYNKFKNYYSMCLNQKEWALGTDIQNISSKDILKINKDSFKFITLGLFGSEMLIKNKIFKSPTLLKQMVDTTGCGDAFLVMSFLFLKLKLNPIIILFLSNIYAGLHGENIGNKTIISKKEFLKRYNLLTNI